MLKHILTGGIDLPKLDAKVSSLELALAEKSEEANEALADHIVKANFRFDDMGKFALTRASADDLDTLKQRVERLAWEFRDSEGFVGTDGQRTLATTVASLSATVAGLQAEIDALTAAKLSEVKARKAPKKSG
jgi:hypothetical protein